MYEEKEKFFFDITSLSFFIDIGNLIGFRDYKIVRKELCKSKNCVFSDDKCYQIFKFEFGVNITF